MGTLIVDTSGAQRMADKRADFEHARFNRQLDNRGNEMRLSGASEFEVQQEINGMIDDRFANKFGLRSVIENLTLKRTARPQSGIEASLIRERERDAETQRLVDREAALRPGKIATQTALQENKARIEQEALDSQTLEDSQPKDKTTWEHVRDWWYGDKKADSSVTGETDPTTDAAQKPVEQAKKAKPAQPKKDDLLTYKKSMAGRADRRIRDGNLNDAVRSFKASPKDIAKIRADLVRGDGEEAGKAFDYIVFQQSAKEESSRVGMSHKQWLEENTR